MRTDQEIREKLAELTYLQSMFGCEDVKKIILTLHWVLNAENKTKQIPAIGNRCINSLYRANIPLSQIMTMSDEEFLSISCLGSASLEWFKEHKLEVYEKLKDGGKPWN